MKVIIKYVNIKLWDILGCFHYILNPPRSECFFMFGAILKATNSSFQKGMTFCRSIYVKKVMKLLAFIFEQST